METLRMLPENSTTWLVQRSKGGDEAARNELISYACERLRRRSREMLRTFPDLRGVEQTDDVLQEALVRLNKAFESAGPLESAQHFWNRATELIRYSLLDLARKHRGRQGGRPKQLTGQADGEGDPLEMRPEREVGEPQDLEEWSEFHEQAKALPDKEKEVFMMRWYGGLSHEEIAAVLGVSEREVQRCWRSARYLLSQRLGGESPQ